MNKGYSFLLLFSLFLCSCATVNNVKKQNAVNNSVTTVFIKLNCPSKFNSLFIDSLIAKTIYCYNQNSKKVHYEYVVDSAAHDNIITLNVLNQNFASPSKVAINYGVIALGLIAAPIYSISNGDFCLFFIPAFDKIFIKPEYINWHLNNRVSQRTVKSRTGVLFRKREERTDVLTTKFVTNLTKFLVITENTITKPYYIN